jgi:hypothetical protein
VLARVLKEFLPVFSTAFECFWWPSVPMLSMGYDPKHFCHGRGRGFEPRRPRHTFQMIYGLFGKDSETIDLILDMKSHRHSTRST